MALKLKTLVRKYIPFAASGVSMVRHRLSQQRIQRLLRESPEICLDLGAGERKGHGEWTTIDVTRNCDVYWDLRRGIPFPNETISKIYSSHFFEHLTFKQAQAFLDDCKRSLVPNGKFLICVPNARLYIEAYVKGTALDKDRFFGYTPAYNCTTRIDFINYIAYMNGEHQYMFDEENLLSILNAKGFRNVRLREFDPSIDIQERNANSIYAEADK